MKTNIFCPGHSDSSNLFSARVRKNQGMLPPALLHFTLLPRLFPIIFFLSCAFSRSRAHYSHLCGVGGILNAEVAAEGRD